jgi:hypothetical protein
MAMDVTAILASQLLDPFRIGLLAFLTLTTLRTSHHTGWLVPLGLGLVFVAVLLPTTLASPQTQWGMEVGVGLLSNSIILLVVLGVTLLAMRLMGRNMP